MKIYDKNKIAIKLVLDFFTFLNIAIINRKYSIIIKSRKKAKDNHEKHLWVFIKKRVGTYGFLTTVGRNVTQ
jgi:hypothetical protein